jgi:mono/diheme cytochrome c family protein
VRAVLLLAVLSVAAPAAAEIPPVAERKAVSLKTAHAEAERAFAEGCGKCHASPDPAVPARARSDCMKRIPEGNRARARAYVSDVRAGKDLYEARCGRCHDLIAPGSRTSEYWSKNMCTSGECFVENLLEEQEQQVLLYLRSQAKKE